MESIEQDLEEVCGVGQVLNVDRHHGKSVLGMIAQVVHDAGLAGPTRRREHHMSDAQRLPQIRQECLAESQVDRVDGSPRVEFGRVLNFHVALVVHQICRANSYTTILMYVNRVLEMRSGCVRRDAAPRRTGHPGHDPAHGSRDVGQRLRIFKEYSVPGPLLDSPRPPVPCVNCRSRRQRRRSSSARNGAKGSKSDSFPSPFPIYIPSPPETMRPGRPGTVSSCGCSNAGERRAGVAEDGE